MNLRDLAEVILVARRSAERIGCTFTLRDDRLQAMGFSSAQIDRAYEAVKEIERYQEKLLSGLDQS